MQNPIQELREGSIVFEKPGTENFDKLQLPHSLMFFAEISHRCPTYQCIQKSVRDFFYFIQILSYLLKFKRPGFYKIVFYIFINN